MIAAPVRAVHTVVDDAPVSVRTAKRLDVQGLRAVAVLLVVLFHAGVNLSGGFTGVDVFFAISGFVIASVLVSELAETQAIDFSRFYARRVKRLLPALALMLAVVSLLGVIASPVVVLRIQAENGVWAALFSANIYLLRLGTGYFDVSSALNPFLHTWTLGVEEQFYIVFPLLLFVGWKLGARRRNEIRARAAAVALVIAITVGSFIEAVTAWTPRGIAAPDKFAFYGSPSRAWEFGLGAALALLIPWLPRLPGTLATALSIAGAVAIAVGAVVIDGASGFRPFLALLPVGGACALFAAGTGHRRGAYPLLASRPMVWIGDLSYSWYLWHWPLIVYARALWPGSGWAPRIAAAGSLIPAWASYRYVESPIRFNRSLRGHRVLVLAAGCVLVGITASLSLDASRHVLRTAAAIEEFSRGRAFHADLVRGCDSPVPLGERASPQCTWTVSKARGRVVLIGDSNAGHFTEPFVRAANRAGYDATVATLSACSFLPLAVRGPGESACGSFGRRSLTALMALKPNLVVAATRTSRYLDTDRIAFAADRSTFTDDRSEKAKIWESDLASYVRRLNAAGIPVIVVHQALMPPTAPNDPTGCAVIRVLLRRCERSFSRRAEEAERALSYQVESRAVAGAPRTWAVDFADDLCGTTTCPELHAHEPLYRDQDHLSVAGALTLTGHFYWIISSRARK